MKLVIHPLEDEMREIDLTKRFVAVIAEELWKLYGGNAELNWIEAEFHLRQIFGQVSERQAEPVVSRNMAVAGTDTPDELIGQPDRYEQTHTTERLPAGRRAIGSGRSHRGTPGSEGTRKIRTGAASVA